MTTTTRRSTSALLFGAAFVASLALLSPSGAALAHSKATSVASHQPATILAKVGGVQVRVSTVP